MLKILFQTPNKIKCPGISVGVALTTDVSATAPSGR